MLSPSTSSFQGSEGSSSMHNENRAFFIQYRRGPRRPRITERSDDLAPVNLGDKARDPISGYEGICVARTHWLNGCVRATLQADKSRTGSLTSDTRSTSSRSKSSRQDRFRQARLNEADRFLSLLAASQ